MIIYRVPVQTNRVDTLLLLTMYACVYDCQACNVYCLPSASACYPDALGNLLIEFRHLSQRLIESVLAHALG